MPGILTGVILGLERAAGETAPILFTGAAFFLPRLPQSAMDATMALPYHIFVISTSVPGMPIQIQYGTVLVLLVFVLGMNLIATFIRQRARRAAGSGEAMDKIVIDHFNIRYSDGNESLRDINLTIPANQVSS